MGLRDRLGLRRPTEESSPGDAGGDSGGEGGDPVDFRPRTDGRYLCQDVGGVALRFSGSSVQETSGLAPASSAAPGPDRPATGEYTSSGRFVVQRRFGRPVVYTVLAAGPDGFSARRTDTNPDGDLAQLEFTFQPD